MKKLLAVAGALALCSGVALAQSVPEKTGVNSALGISPKTQDFATQVANSDMLEIESGKLVATKSDSRTRPSPTT